MAREGLRTFPSRVPPQEDEMAKKKTADEQAEPPKSLDERQAERFETERSGVNILPADIAVLQQPIDDRLAALLEDHKRMGVR
jgi:hypothetical protein